MEQKSLMQSMTTQPWLLSLSAVLLFVVPRTNACSITRFNTTYQIYPDCAQACIACPDSDYTSNFEHNCDYASGDCCSSTYHTTIIATWDCVKTNCGTLAQGAFDSFLKFCNDRGVSLNAADTPAGYTTNGSSAPSAPTNSTGTDSLTTPQIVGIALGSVSAVAGVIGAYFAWRKYKKAKQQRPSSSANRNNNALALQHAPPGQRPWESMPVLSSENGLIYKRVTASWSFTNGYSRTTETFEINRLGARRENGRRGRRLQRPPRASLPASGYIVEEVD